MAASFLVVCPVDRLRSRSAWTSYPRMTITGKLPPSAADRVPPFCRAKSALLSKVSRDKTFLVFEKRKLFKWKKWLAVLLSRQSFDRRSIRRLQMENRFWILAAAHQSVLINQSFHHKRESFGDFCQKSIDDHLKSLVSRFRITIRPSPKSLARFF